MRTAVALLFLLAISLIAAWLYAPYGHSGTDQGFIMGLAWRITEGELTYVDFIHIR